ncbi:hypothetical protein [Luteibacter aegosomatissinici]|uniref:hypothetical protein n=1 Tax=Luteibacter aegosomatissinici TaxID=2911539 RepID=UPI001FF87481|nr:hypothetical protein [Luteibacter aegosomatissinici]UPG95355.1 hypothetical protein L2Y97_04355 [Luteibacter aegosomatissinici]
MDQGSRRLPHWIGTITVALSLICALLIIIPLHPDLPRIDQDASWPLAMNTAAAQHFVFGRDIVFTGGPLLSIYTRQLLPATMWVMWAGAAWVGLVVIAALTILTPRRRWPWLLLVPVVLTLPGMRDAVFLNLPFLLVLVVLHSGHHRRAVQLAGIYSLVATCALLPLIKGSFTLAAVACIALAAIALASRRRIHLVAVPTTFGVALLAGWIGSGQPMSALSAYFTTQAEVIAGYGDAMSVSGPAGDVIALVVACALLFLCSFRVSARPTWPVVLATSLVLFVDFKAGVVRHDGHVALSAVSVMMMAVYFVAASYGWAARAASVVAAALGCIVLSSYADLSPAGVLSRVSQELAGAVTTSAAAITGRSSYTEAYERATDRIRSALPLDAAGKTVDLYTSEASAVVVSDGRWAPRPVFQSYAAFTPTLLDRNAAHLRQMGPQRIFWRVQTIDNRYPSLEDGESWLWLLGGYRPTGYIGDYLQLDRLAAPQALREGPVVVHTTARLGEPVSLPRDTALWARVELQKSLLGRVGGAAYKLPPISISLRYADGTVARYRVIPGMMETGFLISPTVRSTEDLLKLWTEGFPSSPAARVPVEMRIDTSTQGRMWFAAHYDVNVSRIFIPGVAAPQNTLDPVEAAPAFMVPGGSCTLETANGLPIKDGLLPTKAASRLLLAGWAALDAPSGKTSRATYVELSDSAGNRKLVRVRNMPRADVAAVFKQKSLSDAGFEAVLDVSGLVRPIGLAVVTTDGMTYYECPASHVRLP